MKVGSLGEWSIRQLYIVEYKYDGEFLGRIANRLGKRIGKYKSMGGKPKMFTPKLTRVIEHAFLVQDCCRVIIVVDGDGEVEKTMESINKFTPKDYIGNIYYIVFDQEIEEWVTKSLGINVPKSVKPSDALNDYLKNIGQKNGYDKSMLPDFALKLKLNELEKLETFRMFYKLLI